MRRTLWVGGVAMTLGIAACGGGSNGPPASGTGAAATTVGGPAASGLTGFGATTAAWDAHHPSGGVQYSAVMKMGGRIISYDIALPEGTTLAAAEEFVLSQLPPDTKQTAAFAATTSGNKQSCLLLNYQSTTLAGLLGSAPFNDTLGAAGAYLETRSASAPAAALDHSNVNFAGLMLGWNRGGDGC